MVQMENYWPGVKGRVSAAGVWNAMLLVLWSRASLRIEKEEVGPKSLRVEHLRGSRPVV
jgi:hypothetical protein